MSDRVSGYDTEIPPEWTLERVRDLTSRVGSGVTPRGGSDVYQTEGVLFIRSQNVRFEGLDLSDVAFIDQKTHRSMAGSKALPFDVLLNITGASIGRCCVLPDGLGEANVNQHVCTVRLEEATQQDAEFLSSTLASPIGQNQIFRLNAGGNREGLNYEQLRAIEVPWPHPNERKKIARVLTTLDNLIEKTEALIAKYQAIKQGMMHDLFTRGVDSSGQLRPTQEQAPGLYKQSELGWIPKEWDSKRLGEKLKEVDGWLQTGPFGSQLHSYEYVTEGVPVIMPQEINNGVVETETIARITPQKALQMRRHWVDTNDIVFSRRGDLCRSAAIGERESGWVCGTGCFLLRVSKKAIDAEWLSHLYRHPFIQRQVDANAVGSTMPSLNNSVMGRLQFTFPPLAEQCEIARRISAIDSSIRMEGERRSKALLTKSGLMQDLLTGRVRVKVDETEEVAAHA